MNTVSKIIVGAALGCIILTVILSKRAVTTSQQASAAPANVDTSPGGTAEHPETRVAQGAYSIRAAMRDPSSFKLKSALLMPDGTACYEFRANNGFGGVNFGLALLKPNASGVMTSEMEGFSAPWNKRCAHKRGTDYTYLVQLVLGKMD